MFRVFLVALVAFSSLVDSYALRQLGSFSATNPGFLHVVSFASQANDLVISSFTGNPFSSGSVLVVKDIGSQLGSISSIKPDVVAPSMKWPNDFQLAPAGIFEADATIIVADGFLVPGKSDGGIYAIKAKAGHFADPVMLSTLKKGWFYHFIHWIDMNADGKLDILTARATKPVFGSGQGEMIWLEQPSSGSVDVAWAEHFVSAGPDVQFAVKEDSSKKLAYVFACQFFTSQFGLYVLSTADGSLVKSAVIDSTIGPAYAATIVDLNGDGNTELLVTNHAPSAATSAMYAYEMPADLTDVAGYTRHTLASGFPVTEGGSNQAAPGFSYPIQPKKGSNSTEPPTILVAGDGSQTAYQFHPTSAKWNYTQEIILDSKGTVGSLTAADVNGDGWLEVFVPDYDHSTIYIYTYAP